jgi:hypothetical protein
MDIGQEPSNSEYREFVFFNYVAVFPPR